MSREDDALDDFDAAADDLAMLATQIQEFVKGNGELPHPWRIDDWLSNYRSLFYHAEEEDACLTDKESRNDQT